MFRQVERAEARQMENYWYECFTRVRLLNHHTEQLKHPLDINNGIGTTKF